MSSISIEAIKAFADNYIWAIINHANQTAWIVDPGDAEPVMQFINENKLQLAGILITHHHYDHCNGVQQLQAAFDIPVFGPKHDDVLATCIVQQGQTIFLTECDLHFKIMAIPGHTLDHIAYYCAEQHILFCGDTLFSAGCGRIFEGTAEQMYQSLLALAALPDNTKIYCAHEYTLANLAFAKQVEPNNLDVINYIETVSADRLRDKPSLPSDLAIEKKINPFLRTAIPSVIKAAEYQAQKTLTNPVAVFTELRLWKNNFR